MEKPSTAREMILFVCCFLTTFLLAFFNTHTHHPDEIITQQDYPTDDVNWISFEQWRNAYFCLLNTSHSCPDKYQLTLQGRVNVEQVDSDGYCKWGCAEHTRAVLMCIHLAQTNFKFIDNTSVDDINATITFQCDHGFSQQSVVQSSEDRRFVRVNQLSLFINHSSFVFDYPLQHVHHSPSRL